MPSVDCSACVCGGGILMANFKAGSEAVIFISLTGRSLGKIVRVVGHFGDAGDVKEFDDRIWRVIYNNTLLVESLCSPLEYLDGKKFMVGPVPASFLRPVSGIPDVDVAQAVDRKIAK